MASRPIDVRRETLCHIRLYYISHVRETHSKYLITELNAYEHGALIYGGRLVCVRARIQIQRNRIAGRARKGDLEATAFTRESALFSVALHKII